MKNTEIKKALYKQKPTATRQPDEGNCVVYLAYIDCPDGERSIEFNIPYNELSEDFTNEMPAQLLIRWIN